MCSGHGRDADAGPPLMVRIVKIAAIAMIFAAGCVHGARPGESRPQVAADENVNINKNSDGNGAARPDAPPPVWNTLYFTDIGRQLVEPSARIALGRVRSISQMPAGPVIARVDVERWIRTPDEKLISTIAVSAPGGTLERGDEPVLLFLAPFETSYSSLHPLLAMVRGERENLEARVTWIQADLEIAAMPTPAERVAATRERLIRALTSTATFMKTSALRDCARLVEAGEPVFLPEDASRIAAAATRLEDRDFALRLLDLAARIRVKAR